MDDGGQVYPQAPAVWISSDGKQAQEMRKGHAGMSLRDWFAGMALQGLVIKRLEEKDEEITAEEVFAYSAYSCADAMIAERKKEIKKREEKNDTSTLHSPDKT